jgi:hypothetical protein
LVASGSTVTINFKGLPENKEGTLVELHNKGLLEGFNYTYHAGKSLAEKKP